MLCTRLLLSWARPSCSIGPCSSPCTRSSRSVSLTPAFVPSLAPLPPRHPRQHRSKASGSTTLLPSSRYTPANRRKSGTATALALSVQPMARNNTSYSHSAVIYDQCSSMPCLLILTPHVPPNRALTTSPRLGLMQPPQHQQ